MPFDVVELVIDPYWFGINNSHNKYVFYLSDLNDNPISEKITYYIDTDSYYNSRELLFRSSLSGYDVFMMKGEGAADSDFDRKPFQKALPSNFTLDNFETTQGNVLQTKNFSVNTGWIDAVTLNWLTDIFLNKEVFLLINNKAVPFTIISKKQNQKTDNEFLYSIDIELKESYTNTHHSDLNELLNVPASINGGWTIGGNFILH